MAGPIALLFATAGLALLLTAFLAQDVTLAGVTVRAPTSTGNRAVRLVLGLVLVVSGLLIAQIIGPPSPNPPPTPVPSVSIPSSTALSSQTAPPTQSGDTTSCVITISNPLVTMYEKPDLFSLEVGRVPVGDYSPSDTIVVDFAGKQQRYFQISVEGKIGWVLDHTILIARKSAACP